MISFILYDSGYFVCLNQFRLSPSQPLPCLPYLFRLVSLVGGSMGQIGSEGLRRCVETQVQASCLEHLARTLDTIPETLQLIVEGLTQPPGFDIRQGKTRQSAAVK